MTLELAQRALELAGAETAEVVVRTERSGFARFAASEVHQPTLIDDAVVMLRILEDGREAIATTNRTHDEALRELAARAAEACASAAANPALPPPADPSEYPSVDGDDERTASLTADELAHLATEAIDAADGFGLYGYLTAGACELAIASTTGLRAYERTTDATVVALAADESASGYASATSRRIDDLEPAAIAREAAEKAARTRDARELEPGRYRAVLEPYAISDLLFWFGFVTFGAQALLEKRSYFAGRIGEKAFDERVTLVDDALDPDGIPRAFDFEGSPKQQVTLVENGVVRGCVWDRMTAARAEDSTTTGHALPADARTYSPFAGAVSMSGGEVETTDALAELVGDGIYVTRLHYLGLVNPREGVLTGMTRDGTFRIRDGKIAEPLVNLRFTVAMPELLGDVPGLTRGRRHVNQSDFYEERLAMAFLVPALATGCFDVTGTGSGPGL